MREQEARPNGEPSDDVERLLARLAPAPPPPDLAARILARTSRRARVRWGLWVVLAALAGLFAAGAAAVSGYLTGQELVQSGAYALVQVALDDWELVADAPQDYLLALAETVPWLGLLATAACVLAAYGAARPLARAPELFPRASGAGLA
jgi:ABC-type spermidine/putrescine transport system permease subunit I